MQETEIQFDNKKRLKTFFLGVLITTLNTAFCIFLIFFDDKIRIYYILFFGMLSVLSFWMTIKQLIGIQSKEQTAITLSAAGINSKVTPMAKKIGFIPWHDIEELGFIKTYGGN